MEKVIAGGGAAMVGAREWDLAGLLRVSSGGGENVCLECGGGGGGDGVGDDRPR